MSPASTDCCLFLAVKPKVSCEQPWWLSFLFPPLPESVVAANRSSSFMAVLGLLRRLLPKSASPLLLCGLQLQPSPLTFEPSGSFVFVAGCWHVCRGAAACYVSTATAWATALELVLASQRGSMTDHEYRWPCARRLPYLVGPLP
ncbi:hypothetical protein L6452_08168 [Arctium lappa]|uniref:Uncharacterized protein n=1 Tax=Arctium lappa TaxID=4217 RepID=A0ACB9DH11_ARCLA|nr:hypothetical protein L6452_08168 [Arctium lappa]